MPLRIRVLIAPALAAVALGGCQAPDVDPGRLLPDDAFRLSDQPPFGRDSDAAVAMSVGDGGTGSDGDDPRQFGDGDGDDGNGDEPLTGDGDGDRPAVLTIPDTAESCAVSGCPTGLSCDEAGFCVTPPPACLTDDQCAMDERCGLTGECLLPGACHVNGDCAAAESCRSGECTVGTDCGQTELTINAIAPNVLVLLDVSGSMNETLGAGLSKIATARAALGQMTATFTDEIYWGLAMFPGDGYCGPPANVLVPGPGNESGIVDGTPTATGSLNRTPINASIRHVQDNASIYLSDPDRPNYLLFISDGGESSACDGDNNDTTQRIAAMASQGINTFVVGFGDGVDGAALNAFANAGGVPAQGASSYYQADSASQLQAALGTILGSVVGCEFALAEPPEDPTNVWAFVDDVMVERDSNDGWQLDVTNNKVTFSGSACDQLRGGDASDVDVVFGCPEPILE